MNGNRVRALSRLIASLTLLVLPSGALAVTITGISVTNTSDPDALRAVVGHTREFRTHVDSPSAVSTSGLTSSFGSHLSWMLANEVDPGYGGLAGLSRSVGMQIQFTVLDPFNLGYNLSFDGLLRGYVAAEYSPGTSSSGTPVQSSQGFFPAEIDSGSGFSNIPFFAMTGGIAAANEADPSSNLLVASTDAHNAGSFVGTKTFKLLFDTSPSPNVNTHMAVGAVGFTSARFGLDPTHGDLEGALYSNAVDGEAASSHGLFINIDVTAAGSHVPDSGSSGSVLIGAITALLLFRRWRVSA